MVAKHLATRRDFLKVSLAATGVAMLSACGTTSTPASGGTVTLKHWDSFVTQGPWVANEITLFQKANPTIQIKRTVQRFDQYDNLIQFAYKGHTLPDVYKWGGGANLETMVKQKWVSPISDFSDFASFKGSFPNPDVNFVKGSNISVNTGKTYSAPMEGAQVNITLWVNTKVFRDAGLVDGSGKPMIPATLDDMLTAARTIKRTSGGKVYGLGYGGTMPLEWIWSMDLVSTLSSGSSQGGWNYHTGKFDYADNPVYPAIVDWHLKMKSEQLIIPDSASVDDEGIRHIFTQNKFGMLFAGVWVVGGWNEHEPGFKDYAMDHAPYVLSGQLNGNYPTGPGGVEWAISGTTKQLDAAWKWYKWLHSKEAGERWVKAGNGLSIFPDANNPDFVSDAALKQQITLSKDLVKVVPQPGIRNPNIAQVKEKDIHPNEWEILQGAFTGQVKDYQAALRQLQAQKLQARLQAINDAKQAGYDVSIDDYTFSDWDPSKDYITTPKTGS